MIKITYPLNAIDSQWTIFRGFVIGPGNPDSNKNLFDTITYRHPIDYLDEGKGPFHENSVLNQQIEADVLYNPMRVESIPAPTVDYPDRLKLTAKAASAIGGLYANYGFGYSGAVGMNISQSSMINTQYFFEELDRPYHFLIHQISAKRTDPTVITTMSSTECEFTNLTANLYFTWRIRVITYDNLAGWGNASPDNVIDIRNKMTLAKFKDIAASARSATGTWQGGALSDKWTCIKPFSMSRAIVELAMNSAIVRDLYPERFPIEDTHYGDLAMKAAEKVNRTNVNMIAFIRDLRHPMEMIPKLKELKTLKGVANNYLTVNYGVLPTISDLQSIVKAFHRIKPYLDRNGFSTYSAGSTGSKNIGNVSHILEQHVKLAIANEDNLLEKLTQGLDSWGLLPTFENVWDLVPYSFVIDWFLDVGGLLERVDTRLKLLQYNVRYVTMSRKTSSTTILDGSPLYPYYGTVARVQYHRWVSDQCPVPPLTLQTTFQDFNHWLESGALLLQRAK